MSNAAREFGEEIERLVAKYLESQDSAWQYQGASSREALIMFFIREVAKHAFEEWKKTYDTDTTTT